MHRQRAGLWTHPDFLKLWAGQTVSLIGTEITRIAFPLTAVALLNATPAHMGFLGAAQFAPFLLIGFFAGTWVDRWRRRPILLWTTLGQAVLLSSIPTAALLHCLGMTQLYVVGCATGVLTVFFDVAYQAFLPTLIGREHLVEGNSKLTASRSLAQMAGPGLGGGLAQLVTAPLAIAADVGSFLVAALCFAWIQEVEPACSQARWQQSLWADIREGLWTVIGHPLLRPIVASIATSSLFSRMLFTLYVLYATRRLGISPVLLGGILSIGSLGALLGALLAGQVARWYGVGPTLVGAMLLGHLGTLLIPLATTPLVVVVPLLVAAQGLMGCAEATFNITQLSLRQGIIPQRLQGRMNATMRVLGWSTLPLGAACGGLFGEILGVRVALVMAVIGGMTAFLWLLFSPLRRMREPLVQHSC
jgi:MFS family permease